MMRKAKLPALLIGIAVAGCLSYLALRNGVAAAEPSANQPEPKSVVVLVQNPKPLEVVLRTCMQMLDGKGFPAVRAEVVVCGEGCRGLLKSAPQAEILSQAAERGVRVTVCGISLNKLQIDRQQLAAGVLVVDNGLVELFRLKSEGYMSVEL